LYCRGPQREAEAEVAVAHVEAAHLEVVRGHEAVDDVIAERERQAIGADVQLAARDLDDAGLQIDRFALAVQRAQQAAVVDVAGLPEAPVERIRRHRHGLDIRNRRRTGPRRSRAGRPCPRAHGAAGQREVQGAVVGLRGQRAPWMSALGIGLQADCRPSMVSV
jgi:hypothetical protein